MNTTIKNNVNLKNIAANDILSSLGIAHSASLYIQQNESLSIKGFSKMQTVISCLSSTIRTMIHFKDMFIENNDDYKLNLSYYNIENFFTTLTSELNAFFAAGTDVTFTYTSEFEKNRTFYVDINTIEKILYALIYCLVKNLEETDNKEIKINIDEKLNKTQSYIITIKSTGKPISKRLSSIFSKKSENSLDFYDLDVLSLLDVYESVKMMGGSISYVNTKTLNKFRLTLPHLTEFDVSEYHEITPYNFDTNFTRGYFYDLII